MDKNKLRETFEMLVMNGDIGQDWVFSASRKVMLDKVTPRPPKTEISYFFGPVEAAFQAFCVAARIYVNNRHIRENAYAHGIFNVGDVVFTGFTGEITRHKIVAIDRGISQSGVLYQVSPPVGPSIDADRWIDQAWFASAVGGK